MKLNPILALSICLNLFLAGPLALASEKAKKSKKETPSFNLSELALPSEVRKVGKAGGAVYYSPSVKGKVLIPVNFWGAVGRTGLHFVPVDSTLIQGLSYAGGPSPAARIDNVRLSRRVSGETEDKYFDLSDGGDPFTTEKLLPGDIVFLEKDRFDANRTYYTSLIGVAISLLGSILIYRQVKDN